MSATPFRPRSVSELVDAAFQLLRRDHLQYALATALIYVPVMVVAIALGVRFAGSFSPVDANGNMAPGLLFAGFGFLVIFMIALALVDAVIIVVASDAYRGGTIDVVDAYRRAAPRAPAVLGAVIIKAFAVFARFFLAFFLTTILGGVASAISPILGGVVIVAGTIGTFVVALHAWAVLFAVPAATVLEGTGPWRSVGRSRELSAGLRWHVFKALFLAWVIYGLLSGTIAILSMVGTAMSGGNRLATIVLQLAGVAFTVFVYPLIGIVRTLIFYDARIRKEGYDLELLTQELGAAPDARPMDARPAI